MNYTSKLSKSQELAIKVEPGQGLVSSREEEEEEEEAFLIVEKSGVLCKLFCTAQATCYSDFVFQDPSLSSRTSNKRSRLDGDFVDRRDV